MHALSAKEIRERFLRFFEARGHKRLPSDSLVPANDPTLLFTGAGMNQFKDMFLGKGSLPHKRAVTAQKCLRVPDLENVGVTPRHHTFFEMLGNFSFGDYFKKECIRWEWDFFTQELGIPERQLVVTVYEKDDEAYAIWRQDIGLQPERIYRFGEKENFWPAEAPSKGPNGPCGPCSEIYFDAFPDQPWPAPDGLRSLPDDRFTEIGNCVFTQFDRQSDGSLAPLPQKNIDVGLGLERITAVLAGAANNFETDLFRPLLAAIARRAGSQYGRDAAMDVRMRRIADHARAVTFCIADGALPSNEGRGYVVRKILRRAVRDGYELGIEGPFLFELVSVVAEIMGDAYPEVREHGAQCRSLIKSEEEGFATVYRQGMVRLQEFLETRTPQRTSSNALDGSGTFAFQLHDTYGFPVDITRQVLAERGFKLHETEFEAAMEEQRNRARAAMATTDAVFADNAAMVLRSSGVAATDFVGYACIEAESRIEALLSESNAPLQELAAGGRAFLVAGLTPFYAQGGGQVGDRGTLRTPSGVAEVRDTVRIGDYILHRVEVTSGVVRQGETCVLSVAAELRRATERNHTATHLLHAALKNVVGDHVSQAGSEVSPERLRFDYTHGERLSAEQMRAIEDEVNREIMLATPVKARTRPLEEARAMGFVAMFGEKYGDEVRTLSVGDYSRELCGGTHVANSGNIGCFRIVSDQAISAGTRRIEAVTGEVALEMQRREREVLAQLARTLKVPVEEVGERVHHLLDEGKTLRKQLEKATAADVDKLLADLQRAAVATDRGRQVVFRAPGLSMKDLQSLVSRAREALAPFAGVVFAPSAAEVLVAAGVSGDLTGRIRAGDLVQTATAVLGGGGGGRPEQAQGKGKDPARLDAAEAAVREALAAALEG